MCNKRRSLDNINTRLTSIFWVSVIVLPIIICSACSTNSESFERSEVVKDFYPQIAEHILNRQVETLIPFTTHHEQAISQLAWKAISQSRAVDSDSFLETVIERDIPDAWFALSLHPLERNHIQRILEAYQTGQVISPSVCEVFYRHGDQDIMNILLNKPGLITSTSLCALAVSGINTRVELSDQEQEELLNLAFEVDDEQVRRNLMYGFYRRSTAGPILSESLQERATELWLQFGIGNDRTLDKYMVRVLGQSGLEWVMDSTSDQELQKDVQLLVELAKIVAHADLNVIYPEKLNRLFSQKNHVVIAQLLESLIAHDTVPGEILAMIEDDISIPSRNHQITVLSLELLQKHDIDIEPYGKKLSFSLDKNPYLANRILPLIKDLDSDQEFLQRLKVEIAKGGISGMHAMSELETYWQENLDSSTYDEKINFIKREIERGDRSVISGMQGILNDEDLIADEEYDWLHDAYLSFTEIEDRDNMQVLESALNNRFSERFEPERLEEVSFRVPNWRDLYEMGTHPYWIIETNKGKIEVRMDPLSAPFTVSSIDSLTRSGAYDDVVFHRVVPNFVVQGGDFDRRDGLGGPDYRLPTEPSFSSYERASVGIASSGRDTEGSQFYFMHEWAPHLDGNYTRFGEVVRGMDVVDRLQIGDRVTSATISIR